MNNIGIRNFVKTSLLDGINENKAKLDEYLGNNYYPAIIDKATFDKAEEIRMSRAKALGRVRELEVKQAEPFPTKFTMPAVKIVYDDPFAQAAYAYSLIESEVAMDGSE